MFNVFCKSRLFFLYFSSWLFFFTCSIYYIFNIDNCGFNFIMTYKLLYNSILIGIDSMSLCFLILITFFIPLCLFFNLKSKKSFDENRFFFFILLLLEILLILVFIVLDLISFYIVFEFILIPFYVLIVLNKTQSYMINNKYSNRKMHAFFLLFFYTLFGSFLMLFSLISMFHISGTSTIPLLWNYTFSETLESLYWISFFISFSIKIPILPVHLWLPEAHVESPTELSVILASVMLKVGAYGIIRILITMFTESTVYFSTFVWLLCIVSVIYTSLSALVQVDIKRIIAYASIGHMNVCILGIISLDVTSICGSLVLLVAHGLTSGGLFFSIGMLYNRYHTKNFKYFSGIVELLPIFSVCMFFLILSNLSFPGSFNFIGEFLIFTSFFYTNTFFIYYCFFFCVLLTSFYSIWLYNRLFFGIKKKHIVYHITDINFYELLILVLIIFFIFLFGFFPSTFLKMIVNDFNYHFII